MPTSTSYSACRLFAFAQKVISRLMGGYSWYMLKRGVSIREWRDGALTLRGGRVSGVHQGGVRRPR